MKNTQYLQVYLICKLKFRFDYEDRIKNLVTQIFLNQAFLKFIV